MGYTLGIDLGGTTIKIVRMSSEGELIGQTRLETVDSPDAPWVGAVGRAIADIEEAGGERAAGIGIATPGLAAEDGRSIAWMEGRLGALKGLDWTTALAREEPVRVLNDGHAALLGEVWKGSARGFRDVVMLTLGTGVGGAILSEGRLLRGHVGRAGHLGHLSLDPSGARDIVNTPGSLEDAIGECTLQSRCDGRYSSTRELVEAFVKGESQAETVWLKSVRALAAGIVSIANAVDPEAVVLGGGIAQAGPALFDPLARYLDDFEWRPGGVRLRILPSQLQELAGAYGAAYRARE